MNFFLNHIEPTSALNIFAKFFFKQSYENLQDEAKSSATFYNENSVLPL